MRGGSFRTRKMNWIGYAVCGIEDEFQSLRLYDVPPHAGEEAISIAKKDKDPFDTNLMNLRRIKEDDLLILSDLKLNLGGGEDIKQGGGSDFLLKILEQKGTMIAYCSEKWHFGAGYVQL